jgi:hypothetical protein
MAKKIPSASNLKKRLLKIKKGLEDEPVVIQTVLAGDSIQISINGKKLRGLKEVSIGRLGDLTRVCPGGPSRMIFRFKREPSRAVKDLLMDASSLIRVTWW